METNNNLFEELASLNVNEYVERKGRFNYLSWAHAVDILKRKDPNAKWEVMRFDGLPYLQSDCGFFVEVAVTVNEITLSQIHPVLDNNNKPILKPNAFQINTSIQRCLVKAIAIATGLGLYIYAGEDLPSGAEDTPQAREIAQAEPTIEQQEEQRAFFMKKIDELVGQLGEEGAVMIAEFEEKAKCSLAEMNYKVLKRAFTLLYGKANEKIVQEQK
jgi:uncharacterized protein DUF1071